MDDPQNAHAAFLNTKNDPIIAKKEMTIFHSKCFSFGYPFATVRHGAQRSTSRQSAAQPLSGGFFLILCDKVVSSQQVIFGASGAFAAEACPHSPAPG